MTLSIISIMNALRKFIDSNWNIAIFVFLSALGWCFNFSYIAVLIMVAYASFCLLVADNFQSILFLLLGAPYIVGNWQNSNNMTINIVAIAIAIISITLFILKQVIIKKKKCTTGKLFYFFIIALFGYLLGGIIGFFDIQNFIITLAICLLIYLFYWMVLNFVDKPMESINKTILGICTLIVIEIIFKYATTPDFWDAIYNKSIRIGAGEINTSAIYLGLGVCASFSLGNKFQKQYLYLIPAAVLIITTFFTYSRIALAVNCVIFLVGYIFTFCKTKNKKAYSISSILIVVCLGVVLICIRESLEDLIYYYSKLGTSANGRDELWSWCWENFKNNKWFGVGFTNSTPVPSIEAQILDKYIIYAHNSIIQLLTCTGIIGILLNLPLLYKKWELVIRAKTNKTFVFISFLQLLTITLCGMFDASGGLGIFMCFMVFSIVASTENSANKTQQLQNNANTNK